jgi:hypothetical protein
MPVSEQQTRRAHLIDKQLGKLNIALLSTGMPSALMIINCSALTTCHVAGNGEIVTLEFIDEDGRSISVRLSFELAQSIAMTLPKLLTQALKVQTGQDNARYVLPLGEWILEGVEGNRSIILTLKTERGFEASFHIPHGARASLGWSLQHDADRWTTLPGPEI